MLSAEEKNEVLLYNHLRRRYARDLYVPELQYLVDYGDPVDVRGRKTRELLNFVSEITEPWHHCILLPSRRWNPWLALSEFLWILSGRDDVASLAPFNSRISEFSDDGRRMYGAYGARIYHQVDDLIERLRKDPSDRRAVLSIWEPKDLTVNSKDPPCNNLIYFKLREEELHMTVICRSNDIHWGLFAVNIPTFGLLQDYIATRLGVNMGTQTHISNSLHVYEDVPEVVKMTDRMLYGEEDKPAYPQHGATFGYHEIAGNDHKWHAAYASLALEGEVASAMPRFFQYAAEFLNGYKEREIPSNLRSLYPMYEDWIQAGEIFASKLIKASLQAAVLPA